MSPARRESLRSLFDETGTPDHALGRKLLRLDNCQACGAIHWRDCCCESTELRAEPTPVAVERSRGLRLVRAELDSERDGR
jgi:hypothetical protein